MKRIALFCDGTWNDESDEHPTNVFLLSQSVAESDGDVAQVSEYFAGVGTDGRRITGGAWGAGLDAIVLQVYRRLCELYELGDQVFVFGFSRGAYTARSLCGLMRKSGILSRDHLAQCDEAMRIYRERGGGPDSPRAAAFREQYSAVYADPAFLQLPADRLQGQDPRKLLRVRYLGVWDTVGALGVPERIPLSGVINKRHRFHDTSLSSSVEYARHALAIDETRNAFEPSPWTPESIRWINDLHRHSGVRVEQDWFPGDHGSVGGGGEFSQLSGAPLLWIAQGAVNAGLKLEDRHGHLARAEQNDPVNGPLQNSSRKNWLMNLRGRGPRTVGAPQLVSDISDGAFRRIRENDSYLNDDSEPARWRRTTLGRIVRVLRI